LAVVWLHGHRGKGKVCAIDAYHSRLSKSSTWVAVLNAWVDRDDRNDEKETQVNLPVLVEICQLSTSMTYSDGCLVHAASRTSKEDIHDDGHGNSSNVHREGRPNQQKLPYPRILIFHLLKAILGPSMRQIDKQDQTEENVEDGTDDGDVLAPYDEEVIGNEEGDNDKTEPSNNLWSPETVLDRRPLVFGAANTDKEKSHDKVEEAQREVDAMYGDVAIATRAITGNAGVIQEGVLELLDRPVGQHDPREYRVE